MMPKPQIAEILRRALEIIEPPKRWIKGELARDAMDNIVDPDDMSACKFCAEGAFKCSFFLIYGRDYPSDLYVNDIFHGALQKRGVKTSLWSFNDDSRVDHEDVIELFRDAIIEYETA